MNATLNNWTACRSDIIQIDWSCSRLTQKHVKIFFMTRCLNFIVITQIRLNRSHLRQVNLLAILLYSIFPFLVLFIFIIISISTYKSIRKMCSTLPLWLRVILEFLCYDVLFGFFEAFWTRLSSQSFLWSKGVAHILISACFTLHRSIS